MKRSTTSRYSRMVVALGVLVALSAMVWADDCRDGEAVSPKFNLHVVYATQWQGMIDRYRSMGAPSDVRGPTREEWWYRDSSVRAEQTGQDWRRIVPNPMQPKIDKLRKRVKALARSGAASSPANEALVAEWYRLLLNPPHKKNPIDKLIIRDAKRDLYIDRISGDKREAHHTSSVGVAAYASVSMRTRSPVLREGRAFSTIAGTATSGTMSVAGYTCRVYELALLPGSRFCFADLGGRKVLLYSYAEGVPGGPVTQRAQQVDVGKCAPKSMFTVSDGSRDAR